VKPESAIRELLTVSAAALARLWFADDFVAVKAAPAHEVLLNRALSAPAAVTVATPALLVQLGVA
jgi:hypothetical protein